MDGTIQNYTLDMAADTKKDPLEIKQYDTNSRWARISLVAFKSPWIIPFGCQIHISVRKTDGTLANATCTRETESTVLAPITDQMAAVAGTHLGELYFLGNDGDIRSQTFPVVVRDAVTDLDRLASSDDFQVLKDALREVKTSTEAADIAAQYAAEQGNSARDGAQRANDAADSIQVAVDAAANAKACESNAKNSELAAAQTQQAVTDYVESQKAAFVGYSQRESDSKYANALTETVTGEGGVTVEDAWTAPVLGLDVAGKSEQVVTTGKNLFGGKALAEKLLIEVEATVDKANKTVEYNSSKMEGKVLCIDFEEGKEYTIILYGRNKSSQYKSCNLKIVYVDGVAVTMDFETVGSYSYCVFHTNSQRNVKNLSGSWSADSTILYYEKCGIFEGNIALEDFEPYTGGAPSPSPDYPQDIISTGTVSTGAQLWSSGDVSGTGQTSVNIDLAPGTYTFTADITSSDIDSNQCLLYNVSPGVELGCLKRGVKQSLTFTLDDRLSIIRFYASTNYNLSQGDTFEFKNIMLNTGSTPKPWEPYTGCKPSPSVEYPQTLEVRAAGAQLLDSSRFATKTVLGVTFVNNGNGSISASGTATNYVSTTADISLKPGTYVAGGGKSLVRVFLRVFENETNFKDYEGRPCIISGDEFRLAVYVQVDINHTVNGTVWPMLNTGDTALPWEPYQTKSATITLTEPLRGIGEYRDRIMCKDSAWGIERYWKSTVLDGNIPYREYNQLTTSKEIRANEGIIKIKPINGLFSNLKIVAVTWDNDKLGIGCFTSGPVSNPYRSISLRIPVDADVAEYMAANPTEVIYQPYESPTWEPLPDATQQALNELTTYAGTTHLTLTAGGPAAEVTLEYVKDTHKALEQCQEAAKEYTDTQIAAIVAALPTATQAAIVDNQTTRLLQEV